MVSTRPGDAADDRGERSRAALVGAAPRRPRRAVPAAPPPRPRAPPPPRRRDPCSGVPATARSGNRSRTFGTRAAIAASVAGAAAPSPGAAARRPSIASPRASLPARAGARRRDGGPQPPSPDASTWRTNSSTSRVLPIPVSPSTSTTVGRPAHAASHAAASSASAALRPTRSGVKSAAEPGRWGAFPRQLALDPEPERLQLG